MLESNKDTLIRYSLLSIVMCALAVLYIPIVVLIVFSFNLKAFPYKWDTFSFHWYIELYNSPEIWLALKYSLFVALCATVLSISMGVLFLFYGAYSGLKNLTVLFYSNLFIPEIIIAVALLSFFTFLSIPTGLITLIVAHTLIGLSFALPILITSFEQLQKNVIEASLDLGASLNQTLWYIVLPLMRPSIIAAGLLVFVLSFDDYIIAFFCTSSTVQTLPLYIFSMIRTGVSPTINALSTLLLVSSTLIIIVIQFVSKGKRFV